jgi:pyruvate/2-oxoglutarate/acetoin dehydrogenase E1 component
LLGVIGLTPALGVAGIVVAPGVCVGLAVGAAMTGMHPVPEIMFGDFITLVMDQIVNQAAKMRYMTGGQVQVPITIRATMGGGRSSGGQHSQSWHAWMAHVPGLKVVVPSTPYDAKGLLKTSIRDNNPVVFIESEVLYGTRGEVPDGEHLIPLGIADIKRRGKDVTLIAHSRMVSVALDAAAVGLACLARACVRSLPGPARGSTRSGRCAC